ncbi:wiskott-Aldrich syndrome protein homolog 1-like [Dermochelys coriacea]|uniref:wiskott-Aldrich syndrome protein homolog 1-like n=1 Tax=Dermochelys coriacea TaxID=27794 RepID=UPI001CA882EE|nr:wiskott-Aldrich syndrome protein homolog 1-like [Dermochelys coriacea]
MPTPASAKERLLGTNPSCPLGPSTCRGSEVTPQRGSLAERQLRHWQRTWTNRGDERFCSTNEEKAKVEEGGPRSCDDPLAAAGLAGPRPPGEAAAVGEARSQRPERSLPRPNTVSSGSVPPRRSGRAPPPLGGLLGPGPPAPPPPSHGDSLPRASPAWRWRAPASPAQPQSSAGAAGSCVPPGSPAPHPAPRGPPVDHAATGQERAPRQGAAAALARFAGACSEPCGTRGLFVNETGPRDTDKVFISRPKDICVMSSLEGTYITH